MLHRPKHVLPKYVRQCSKKGRLYVSGIPLFKIQSAVLSFNCKGNLTKLLCDKLSLQRNGKYSREEKYIVKQILCLTSELYTYVEIAGQNAVCEKLAKQFPEVSNKWVNEKEKKKWIESVIERPFETVLSQTASYIDLNLLLKVLEDKEPLYSTTLIDIDDAVIDKIIESLSHSINNDRMWVAPKEIRACTEENTEQVIEKVFRRCHEIEIDARNYYDNATLKAATITCYGFRSLGAIAVLRAIRSDDRINLTSAQKHDLIVIMSRYCGYSKSDILDIMRNSLCSATKECPNHQDDPEDKQGDYDAILAHIVATLNAENKLKGLLAEDEITEHPEGTEFTGPSKTLQYWSLKHLLEYASEFYFVSETEGRSEIIKNLQLQANLGQIDAETIDEDAFSEFFSEILRYTAGYADMKKLLEMLLPKDRTKQPKDKITLFNWSIKNSDVKDVIEIHLEECKRDAMYDIYAAINKGEIELSTEVNTLIITCLHTKCNYPISALLRLMNTNLKSPYGR